MKILHGVALRGIGSVSLALTMFILENPASGTA